MAIARRKRGIFPPFVVVCPPFGDAAGAARKIAPGDFLWRTIPGRHPFGDAAGAARKIAPGDFFVCGLRLFTIADRAFFQGPGLYGNRWSNLLA